MCLIIVVGLLFFLLQYISLSQLGHVSQKLHLDRFEADLNEDNLNQNMFKSRKRIVDGSSKFDIDNMDKINDFDYQSKFTKPQDIKNLDKSKNAKDIAARRVFDHRYNENNYAKLANAQGGGKRIPKDKIIGKLEIVESVKSNSRIYEGIKQSDGLPGKGGHNLSLPLGVHQKDKATYWISEDGFFTCIQAYQVLMFHYIFYFLLLSLFFH